MLRTLRLPLATRSFPCFSDPLPDRLQREYETKDARKAVFSRIKNQQLGSLFSLYEARRTLRAHNDNCNLLLIVLQLVDPKPRLFKRLATARVCQ